jgi:hypothetical protein
MGPDTESVDWFAGDVFPIGDLEDHVQVARHDRMDNGEREMLEARKTLPSANHLSEAISMEKRYFTSDLSSLS